MCCCLRQQLGCTSGFVSSEASLKRKAATQRSNGEKKHVAPTCVRQSEHFKGCQHRL